MLFGTATWATELLRQMAARVRDRAGYPPDRVFFSLYDDRTLIRFAPADRFVALRPTGLPVDQPGVTGGGRLNTGFDMKVRAALFVRLTADQEFRSDRHALEAEGVMAQFRKVLDALQMFEPVKKAPPAADVGITRQPVRIDPGADVLPMTAADGTPWAVCVSLWSVPFTSDIPAS